MLGSIFSVSFGTPSAQLHTLYSVYTNLLHDLQEVILTVSRSPIAFKIYELNIYSTYIIALYTWYKIIVLPDIHFKHQQPFGLLNFLKL
jgi:hypothetical protein